jgi:pimeloyl-ACP methyl ester carboxylesterase
MRPWIRLATLLCSLLCGVRSYAAEPALSGSWTGSWVRDGDALTVTMHFKRQNAGWVGDFDSDRLRVIGIPLRDVVVTLPRVTWKVVGDETTMTFEGELHGNTLAGEFEEAGARGKFRLKRIGPEAPQGQERDFAFNNGAVALSGTLLLPDDSKRKVPAVVFLHGSGAEARWASKYLATRFARAGIAALIFDKRGVGQSGGDWRTATYDDLAGDGAAAVEALLKNASIDPTRIGLHGHSQGGTLAPLVAAKLPNLAFVIASAAAGLPVDQVEVYSLENSVNIDALSADDAALARRYIAALVGAAYRGEPREQLSSLWEKVRGKPWAFPPPADDNPYWSFSRSFNAFEPITYWRRVNAPILLLYGEADKRVPPRASAARIAEAVLEGAGNSVSVHIFPDADHTFRLRSLSLVWPTSAPGYPDLMIEWTRRVTGVADGPA